MASTHSGVASFRPFMNQAMRRGHILQNARKFVRRTLKAVLASYRHVLLSSRTLVGSGPWRLLLISYLLVAFYII
jgi:hypothetical protein